MNRTNTNGTHTNVTHTNGHSHSNGTHTNGSRVASNASSLRLSHKPSIGDFVPDKKPHYLPGHAETLTLDQEYVLKETWSFLLKQAGYQVELPLKLKSSDSTIHRTTTVSSLLTSKSASTSGGKKKLFGKLNKKKHHDTAAHSNGTNVDRLTEQISKLSTDPGISLEDEKQIIANLKGFSPDKVKEHFFNFLRHDTPDNLVLRFVRARKFNAGKSLVMLSNTLKWRVETYKVDELLKENELGQVNNKGVMKAFEVGKLYFRGYDKDGRPLVVVRPRFHHSSLQTERETELFTLLIIEYARLILTEPVDSLTILFDLTGFSLANMDYAPVKFMISVFEAHYPESLGVLLIHKAPWIFGGIWSVIKNWLDPVVASKINFTRNTKDLLNFIPKDQLSKEHGGLDTFEYKYLQPTQKDKKLSPDKRYEELVEERKQLIEDFIESTILWIESTSTAENDQYRKDKLLIGKELANNYVQIHPYLVNKTFYHKIGVVDMNVFDIFYDTN